MTEVIFKKQLSGWWRRDDGETARRNVPHEEFKEEVAELIRQGWRVSIHGTVLLRSVVLTAPKSSDDKKEAA